MKKELPTWRTDNIYAFFVAICISVFSFSALYFGLSNKIDLLSQKVDNFLERTDTNTDSIKELQKLYSDQRYALGICCDKESNKSGTLK